MNTRRGALVAVAMLAAGGAAAAEPVAEVDAELLEFLGSLDSEDEDWREYLADRPVRAEAGKPATPETARPAPREQQSKPPAKQQDKVKKP